MIAKRHEEHLDLAKEVTQYLEKQSASLCKDACQTCDFYERVGKAVEANHKNISDMDEAMEDDLFDIKEDQRVRNEDTEEELRQECHNTRHAADADALEVAFGFEDENAKKAHRDLEEEDIGLKLTSVRTFGLSLIHI